MTGAAHWIPDLGLNDRGKAGTKLGLLGLLGLASSEKQMPQVVEKFEVEINEKKLWNESICAQRRLRYQAARCSPTPRGFFARPDCTNFCTNFSGKPCEVMDDLRTIAPLFSTTYLFRFAQLRLEIRLLTEGL